MKEKLKRAATFVAGNAAGLIWVACVLVQEYWVKFKRWLKRTF